MNHSTLDLSGVGNSYIDQLDSVLRRVRLTRIRDRLTERLQGWKDFISPADAVQIHLPQSKNLGDISIGRVVQEWFRNRQVRISPQNILSPWRPRSRSRAIIGGGGLLHSRVIAKIANECLPESKIGIIGVDVFGQRQVEFPESIVYASARSQAGVERLKTFGCQDPVYLPDVVWAARELPEWMKLEQLSKSVQKQSKIAIMNVTPWPITLFFRLAQAPSRDRMKICRESPDEHEIYESYCRMIIGLAQRLDRMGYRVRHLPFAIDDDLFARSVLANSPVEFVPFRTDMWAVWRDLISASWLISSRYHAHVFGMMARTPMSSLAYEPKCQQMWETIGLDPQSQVAPAEMLQHPEAALDRLLETDGVVLPEEACQSMQQSVAEGLTTIGERLGLLPERRPPLK